MTTVACHSAGFYGQLFCQRVIRNGKIYCGYVTVLLLTEFQLGQKSAAAHIYSTVCFIFDALLPSIFISFMLSCLFANKTIRFNHKV